MSGFNSSNHSTKKILRYKPTFPNATNRRKKIACNYFNWQLLALIEKIFHGSVFKKQSLWIHTFGLVGFFKLLYVISSLVYLQTSYPQLIYISVLINRALKSKAVEQLDSKTHITKNIGEKFASFHFSLLLFNGHKLAKGIWCRITCLVSAALFKKPIGFSNQLPQFQSLRIFGSSVHIE